MNIKDPISKLPFVGPIYAKRLEKLGIFTIEDLLFHFPFRYDDFSVISPIGHTQAGETVTIQGIVEKITNSYTKSGKKIQKAEINDSTGKIESIWFNQPYLAKTIKTGEKYNFSGKVDWFGHIKVLVSPEFEIVKSLPQNFQLSSLSNIHTGRLVPVYNETYGVSSKWLRSRIKMALEGLLENIEEFLPEEVIKKENLLLEKKAIFQIHFPENKTEEEKARNRLAFDELFLIQLAGLSRKKEWQGKVLRSPFIIDQKMIEKFIKSLPFSLTKAQNRCLAEILSDLEKPNPMNRLLQGDVGSGKTVVAAAAAYAAFLNKNQTLFMAPTEILANQHYDTLKILLEPLGMSIGLVTGNHKEILNFDIIVGTHALLYQDFDSKNVGLVIVDEQHRFGVEQRLLLSQKGINPHFLTMTATPIPRTIALTLFGDLDLSVIDEMPEGRLKVKTWMVPKEKRTKAYTWIKERIKDTPEQAFIICPLIEESETLTTIRAATKEFETLSKVIFPDLRLGLLHGRVKSKEKEEVLGKFKRGELDILVATPVVEVGIDIPNATIMVIEASDRFGLAQLHQLRGRVGRSNLQSYCFLFTENETPLVIERLKALEKTNIGMELSEIDLKLRGPGEIYGTHQHGFPDLKIASFTNLDLIQKTREQAKTVLESHLSLLTSSSPLKNRLQKYKIEAVTN